MSAVLLSPHHDDETLFASFTIIREKPTVVVVLESHLQEQRGNTIPGPFDPKPITNDMRRAETFAALHELEGVHPTHPGDDLTFKADFWPFRDDRPDWAGISLRITELVDAYDHVYAPLAEEGGHVHHNAIGALVAAIVPEGRRTLYRTYAYGGSRTAGEHVPYESEWVARKMRALACYTSQINLWPHHFLSDQREYYAT